MKKMLVLLTSLLLGFSSHASGDIFSEYEVTAKTIVTGLRNGQNHDREILKLIKMGYEIMDLFTKKLPECKDQYVQVKSEDREMAVLEFDRLHSRYHNGEGLIAAPPLCYAGRSMAVHPYMALALIREKRNGADNEIDEVARRAPKIKARLGL